MSRSMQTTAELYQQNNDQQEQKNRTESLKDKIPQIAAVRASFMVAYNIAKHSNWLCDCEFVKICMLEVVGQVCREYRKKVEEISLSRMTISHFIEAIDEDLKSQLKRRVPSCQLFTLALDESTDIDDTAGGISLNFEITEELLSMESLKGTSTENIFKCVENALHKMELPWHKMTSITTDGSPSWTGKKVGLLKRMSDHAAEVVPTRN
ncbi:Zinc finger BED domain-containing protein 5 [Thelohanellus kitauei]|uniref:Zinc finger BED domain-containing protein 5 n=1 Tax=Thelohanellus kitauei TaxID=669202 RepID=A0A0C2JVJ2_THEKT|nr:Zinc finger BED domain-containing protein 5 [Thelohanellus kitauei]